MKTFLWGNNWFTCHLQDYNWMEYGIIQIPSFHSAGKYYTSGFIEQYVSTWIEKETFLTLFPQSAHNLRQSIAEPLRGPAAPLLSWTMAMQKSISDNHFQHNLWPWKCNKSYERKDFSSSRKNSRWEIIFKQNNLFENPFLMLILL